MSNDELTFLLGLLFLLVAGVQANISGVRLASPLTALTGILLAGTGLAGQLS